MVSRVILIHWKPVEGAVRARPLQRAGHDVEVRAPGDQDELRKLVDDPPDAFVIDLDRTPSHGRDLALWLRQRKATRRVPIVFVAGDPDKVARVQELIPDAVFTQWRRIRGDLARAIRTPPAEPVVKHVLAGYSGTPLPKKLGIKAGSAVALMGAPPGFEKTLGKLPDDVAVRRSARGHPDRIVLFVKSRAELARRFPVAARALATGGGLWIAWPKKASGVSTDLTQGHVRAFGLESDFVDYKICAIDDTWSGLQFARRRR
jgi:CheY-like chemotaxis protein